MAEDPDKGEQAYLMIYKDGKMWPAVRCRLPMEIPAEKLPQPTQFHVCVFIPIIHEFHWKMESDLTGFDNGELNKFTKANEPERFGAFEAVLERMGETGPDYGLWASEILAHKLHRDFYENEPVHYEPGDSDLEIVSSAKVVDPLKPHDSGSGSGNTKRRRQNTQSRLTNNAKLVKPSSWLSQINQEATQNIEQREKRKKRKSTYIPDEIDDEPERPRKKSAKPSQVNASKGSGELGLQDFSSPSRADSQNGIPDMDDECEYIDDLELVI